MNAMNTIFLWFYRLPIAGAVFLTLLITAAFLFLRDKYGKRKYWTSGIALLLLCWTLVILFATLGQRAEGETLSDPVLIPFYSYYTVLKGGPRELCRANLMNAILFYPAGLFGCELLPPGRRPGWKIAVMTGVFALLSIGIEYTQYRMALGLAETDDVIHNALGALLGALACRIPTLPLPKHR